MSCSSHPSSYPKDDVYFYSLLPLILASSIRYE
jgi:hypothetical protein